MVPSTVDGHPSGRSWAERSRIGPELVRSVTDVGSRGTIRRTPDGEDRSLGLGDRRRGRTVEIASRRRLSGRAHFGRSSWRDRRPAGGGLSIGFGPGFPVERRRVRFASTAESRWETADFEPLSLAPAGRVGDPLETDRRTGRPQLVDDRFEFDRARRVRPRAGPPRSVRSTRYSRGIEGPDRSPVVDDALDELPVAAVGERHLRAAPAAPSKRPSRQQMSWLHVLIARSRGENRTGGFPAGFDRETARR